MNNIDLIIHYNTTGTIMSFRAGVADIKSVILLFCIHFFACNAYAQTLAFPTAEGVGRYATGGRGGDVYHITNLRDSGSGSLRHGLESAHGPRTIIFDISGNIHLTTDLIIGSDITIAGQSAPGDGITICDRKTSVNGDNIIIRYMRFRPGDTYCPDYEPDSLGVSNSSDVMIDHVSASWGIDEVLSVTNNSTDVTVQWSLVTEALHNSCHSGGNHGYGSLIIGGNFTFHHNLYAHNRSRNPRPGAGLPGTYLDWVNNVVYNPGDKFGYTGEDGAAVYINYVGNYGISGPDTNYPYMHYSPNADTHIFQSANKMDTDKDGIVDGYNNGWGMFYGPETQHGVRFDLPEVLMSSADEAYLMVLAEAGASLVRDAVDKRLINTVIDQTGHHIDSQTEVGGWPILNSTLAPQDTDKDGMPDAWEIICGLNLNNPNDRNDDRNNDGYTNLEEYLNWLCTDAAKADVNNDYRLDFSDFVRFTSAWLSTEVEDHWDPQCNIHAPSDDIINGLDLLILIENWLIYVE